MQVEQIRCRQFSCNIAQEVRGIGLKISLILVGYIVKFCGLCITVHHTQHSMNPFILQQIWKVNNIWVLQDVTLFKTVKHYTVKCKYKVCPMFI